MIKPAPRFNVIIKNTNIEDPDNHIRVTVHWYKLENFMGKTWMPRSSDTLNAGNYLNYPDLCSIIDQLTEVKEHCDRIKSLPDGCYVEKDMHLGSLIPKTQTDKHPHQSRSGVNL